MKLSAAAFALAGSALVIAQPASAQDLNEDFELWFAPSVDVKLDDDTTVGLQTAQRFRDSTNGRPDTYYARGWIKQKVAKNVTLGFAAEQRVNDGSSNEKRVIQQIAVKHGVLRGRFRVEQRFVEGNDGRLGLRLRPRIGARIPLGETSPLTATADAELFYTARATSIGGSTGVTGVETRVGVVYKVSDNFSLGVKYLRAQSIRTGADRVSNAPLIELGFKF